ncbi:MAG: UbiA family prenyltransferase [Candidatus Acidiferrales bacterium]
MNPTHTLSVTAKMMDRSSPPLCVDLDGTLIRTDLLHEAVLLLLRRNFLYLFCLPFWLLAGKAALKHRVAQLVAIDPAGLPYNRQALAWIHEQKERGRYIVLATASNRQFADKIAAYLGCFNEVLASDSSHNLSAEAKRAVLVKRFGDKGFDYAGNSREDLAVWKHCHRAIVVHASPRISDAAQEMAPVTKEFPKPATKLKTWFRAARAHQWVKNLLVFVPLITAHRYLDVAAVKSASLLFLAFSAAASTTYVINDLLDLTADRRHPIKSSRPFACGDLSLWQGLILALFCLAASAVFAAFLPLSACVILGCYLILTLAYSMWLKQALILDVLVLATLYTIRIIAGGAATNIRLSEWLISFSLFLFLSLAICKRSSELMALLTANKTRSAGRSYRTKDLEPLNICGISSGMVACLLILLYGSSQQATSLYASPRVLYLLCPILFYWISRLWILTFRGVLKEDPILFAVRDRTSYMVVIAVIVVVMFAAFVQTPLNRFLQ